VLWAGQTRLIFEPMRDLIVKPPSWVPVAEVVIPVRTVERGSAMLHACGCPVARADAR